MPNPLNRRTGGQWDTCDRCGFLFPIGQLVKQKGSLVCQRRSCFHDLTIEHHPYVVGQILGVGEDQEGSDLRVVDRGFFDQGSDEGVA